MIAAAVLLAGAVAIGAGITARYVREIGIPGSLIVKSGRLSVLEHEPKRGADGVYSPDPEKEVSESAFVLMPGVDAARDPFVRITDVSSVKEYVYVETVSTLNEKVTFELTEDWIRLDGVEGNNGGAVYAYKDAISNTFGDGEGETETDPNEEPAEPEETKTVEIKLLKDDKVTVSHTYIDSGTEETELSFYPYLVKATEGKTAAECFDKDKAGHEDKGKYTPAPQGSVSVSGGKAVVGETGYSVYVRAAIIVNWQDANGEILAKGPVEGSDYSFTPGEGWTKGSDGYYYYSAPVESGGETSVLTSQFEKKTEAPEGYSLKLTIAAEVIQTAGTTDDDDTPAVTAAWGCAVGEDGRITK